MFDGRACPPKIKWRVIKENINHQHLLPTQNSCTRIHMCPRRHTRSPVNSTIEINFAWFSTIKNKLLVVLLFYLAPDLPKIKSYTLPEMLKIKYNHNAIWLPTLVFLDKHLIILHLYLILIILSSIIGPMAKAITHSHGKAQFLPRGQLLLQKTKPQDIVVSRAWDLTHPCVILSKFFNTPGSQFPLLKKRLT